MTPLFGPGWGNYAIAGIVEIALPEPVSLFPSTPGWWLLLLALCIFAGRRAMQRWRRYRRNAYRRAAISALEKLHNRYDSGDPSALGELAALLRATAIQACGDRESLASLRGQAWRETVAGLAPAQPPLPTETLDALAYAPRPSNDMPSETTHYAALFHALDDWLRHHQCLDD